MSTKIDTSVQDVNHLNFFNTNTLDDLSDMHNDEERRNPSPNRHSNSPSHSGSPSASSKGNDGGHFQDPDAFTALEENNSSSEGNVFRLKTSLEASQHMYWVDAMNAEMDALYRNNTWELADLLAGRKPIGSKEGIGFDKKNSPVIKIVTVRCLINLAVQSGWSLFQMDINNAFLYGDLNEFVYMTLPHSKSDYSLFTKSCGDVFIALLVYVDDIIITGNNLPEINKVKQFLKTKFMIKDLGKLKYFLGIEVLDTSNGVLVCA
ncbi:ribonuclease H-like domain-containing protein [Tanacetum coccineum]